MACCERIATCFMVGSLYKAALLSILGILEGITGCVETVCWYSVDKHQRHVDLRRGIDIVSDMKRIGWYSHNTSGNQFKSLDQLTEIDHSSHLIWPTTININNKYKIHGETGSKFPGPIFVVKISSRIAYLTIFVYVGRHCTDMRMNIMGERKT